MLKVLKNIGTYVLIFCILLVIFNVLMLLSSLFPSTLIEKNVIKSSEVLLNERAMYKISKIFNQLNDTCTDTIMVNAAYSIDNKSPVESYLKVRKIIKETLQKFN